MFGFGVLVDEVLGQRSSSSLIPRKSPKEMLTVNRARITETVPISNSLISPKSLLLNYCFKVGILHSVSLSYLETRRLP